MFNISFAELMVILLLAFLVLGPKEMSKVARFLGRAVKKCQKFLVDMKAYVNDSTEDSSLKEIKTAVSDVKETVDSVKNEVDKVNPVGSIRKEIEAEIKPIKEIQKLKNPLEMTKDAVKKDTAKEKRE